MADTSAQNRAERLRARSQQRRATEKQELRQAILDAAGALFLEQGYAGFSLRQVAERIGYSPGTIYLYFADKDDLLFEVADAGFRLFIGHQQQALATASDPKEQIRALARAYLAFGLEHRTYYRLMFVERTDLLYHRRAAEASGWLSALTVYQQVFRAAAEAGALRQGDLTAMSDAWWATLHGMVTLATSMAVVFDDARIAAMGDAALEMLFGGFGRAG